MTLERTPPAPKGYNLRTFECARLVLSDPMKTGDALRWLDGELKPPA
jgi:hypothetical protein